MKKHEYIEANLKLDEERERRRWRHQKDDGRAPTPKGFGECCLEALGSILLVVVGVAVGLAVVVLAIVCWPLTLLVLLIATCNYEWPKSTKKEKVERDNAVFGKAAIGFTLLLAIVCFALYLQREETRKREVQEAAQVETRKRVAAEAAANILFAKADAALEAQRKAKRVAEEKKTKPQPTDYYYWCSHNWRWYPVRVLNGVYIDKQGFRIDPFWTRIIHWPTRETL